MKITILPLALIIFIGFAQAEYFVHIKLPIDIKFVNNDGQPSSPNNPETPVEPVIDCDTQADLHPEECDPAAVGWEKFANDNNLTFESNWNDISWMSKSLTYIPTELYPNQNPANYILLQSNQLTNIDGLASLITLGGNINLHSNQLTDLNGLANLISVKGSFYVYSNALTNVNGLRSLNSINGALYLYNNKITDITGLENAEISSMILIDDSYNGPKMLASSRFCSLNDASKFPAGYAQKSQLCEI